MAGVSKTTEITLTYKYKLYHTKRQRYLHGIIDIASEIYNHCIALHKKYHRLYGKHLNKYTLQKHLTKLKKLPKYSHWKTVPSQAIQDITDRIERAYTLFFKYLEKKKKGLKPAKVSPPGFKKKTKYKSFTLKQAGYKIEGNIIYISGRKYKFWLSRPIEGKIKTVTVKRDRIGDIYIFVTVKKPAITKVYTTSGKIVGVDFGLKTFLTLSDGTKITLPRFYKKRLKELKKLHRKFSKKQKNSNKWRAYKRKIAKLERKIADTRRDYFYKLINSLVKNYDTFIIEDLNLKPMWKRWGKKLRDYAYGDFVRMLSYKAEVVKIDRFYPSSKLCSVCGYINHALTLNDREWICPNCGARHDRDINAAVNIARAGAPTLSRGEIRPCLSVALPA